MGHCQFINVAVYWCFSATQLLVAIIVIATFFVIEQLDLLRPRRACVASNVLITKNV